MNTTTSELQQLKDMSVHQKRRITEMLTHLLKDLAEIGVSLGNDTELKVILRYYQSLLKCIRRRYFLIPCSYFQLGTDGNGKLEEEFTVARLYISKMKSEVKNLIQRMQSMESSQTDSNKKVC